MQPYKFHGCNVELPGGIPAEAKDGKVLVCLRLTAHEVEQICDYGEIWLTQHTGGNPYQLTIISAEREDDF